MPGRVTYWIDAQEYCVENINKYLLLVFASRIALDYFPKKKNSQITTGFTAVIAELDGIR